MCQALGIKHLTNGQLRPTAIQLMVHAGFQDRDIQHITGHKCADSLKSYAPIPPASKKIDMARAISNAGCSTRPGPSGVKRKVSTDDLHDDDFSQESKVSSSKSEEAFEDDLDPELLSQLDILETQLVNYEPKKMKLTESHNEDISGAQWLKNEQRIAVQQQELMLNQIQIFSDLQNQMAETAKNRQDFAKKYFQK